MIPTTSEFWLGVLLGPFVWVGLIAGLTALAVLVTFCASFVYNAAAGFFASDDEEVEDADKDLDLADAGRVVSVFAKDGKVSLCLDWDHVWSRTDAEVTALTHGCSTPVSALANWMVHGLDLSPAEFIELYEELERLPPHLLHLDLPDPPANLND